MQKIPILAAFIVWGMVATTAGAADLQVGVAEAVITPTLSTPMAGYYFDRSADGVHDDLKAKALVFQADGETVGLVACDLISLPESLVDAAKARIQERCGLAPDRVIVSATHAHTGPKHQESYDAWLVEKIADAVQTALGNLAPATLGFAVGDEPRLPHQRRYWMKDGTLRTNPGKMNPDVDRPAGGIDPAVPVLQVSRPDGTPRAFFVNYALHLDTIGGTRISADFPCFLSSKLRRIFGNDLITVFTIGAAGNINHWDVHDPDPQRSFAESERIGTVLAGEVLKMSTMTKAVAPAGIGGVLKKITLPMPVFSDADVKKAQAIAKIPNPPGVDFVPERVWALKVLDVVGRNQPNLETVVQALHVGDFALAAVPCELFYELGLEIKQKSPFPHTVVVELANDDIGYVPRAQDYPNGGYEVFSTRLAQGGGEQLVAEALKVLQQLKRSASR